MSDTTPEHRSVEPPASASAGDGRYVKEPSGEDPRDADLLQDADTDADTDADVVADVAAPMTGARHVTHAEPVDGDMGVSSDDAGHNPADRDQLDG